MIIFRILTYAPPRRMVLLPFIRFFFLPYDRNLLHWSAQAFPCRKSPSDRFRIYLLWREEHRQTVHVVCCVASPLQAGIQSTQTMHILCSGSLCVLLLFIIHTITAKQFLDGITFGDLFLLSGIQSAINCLKCRPGFIHNLIGFLPQFLCSYFTPNLSCAAM